MSYISEESKAKIVEIVTKKGKGLRATKPKTVDNDTGRAAYIWRYVAFCVSPKSIHHCLPMMAFCYLSNEDFKVAQDDKKFYDELHAIVNEIVDSFPKESWHGVRRWGTVLGRI